MDIIKTYEVASGQEVNMSKSEVIFSRNLSMAAQEDLSRIMGVKHVLGTGTYLGLPSMVGRSKKSTFAYIKDQIWKRINSWRGRALSRAGKEVLIKSVLQSIPSYVMSVYIIPETTIKEIERMFNSFWWGGGSNNRGIKWLVWDRMTFLKEYGGLGFRNLQLFNMAMVAKRNSLVEKVYKARNFPNSSFLASHLCNNSSYAWRSIWKSRQVLLNGCRRKIGDGTNIKVMNEPWLKKEDGKWMQSPQEQGVSSLYVNQLMLANGKVWDNNKVSALFPINVANSILAVPLYDDIEEDQLVWDDDMHENYNVRKTSAGWCVRDCRGQFVLGGSSWILGRRSVNEGEALAMLEATKELHHRGFNNVIFETDAQNIVNAIHHRNIGVSEFSSIIHKIKSMLSNNPDRLYGKIHKAISEFGCSHLSSSGHFTVSSPYFLFDSALY
ncbi:unnamed protein product [Trifolium pratense]|uniref:Uncharacterized protein n=1 Tax=Trifolium pratense TaxID=57577 RepID=A0ACB0LWF3_TRIPR|nr:unnamed protein product [Trifolium pratense]